MLSSLTIHQQSPHLLAIDLGLSFGWACYSREAQLIAYGSHHCSQANKLKKITYSVLRTLPQGSILVVEGGGDLLQHWLKTARRFQIETLTCSAEDWRAACFLSRDIKTGKQAKANAEKMAKGLIKSQAGHGPTSLRHDTAEACLLGWWALANQEWIDDQLFRSKLFKN